MGRLFLDMDGVLTDFDLQFHRWFGHEIKIWLYKTDPGTKATIDRCLKEAPEEFWSDMPWISGAEAFWDELVPRSPVILSAPHYNPVCGPGKQKWVRRYLGPQVTLILDPKKGEHGRPGDILVDDSPTNSEGWKGRFVLHRDWDETRRLVGYFP